MSYGLLDLDLCYTKAVPIFAVSSPYIGWVQSLFMAVAKSVFKYKHGSKSSLLSQLLLCKDKHFAQFDFVAFKIYFWADSSCLSKSFKNQHPFQIIASFFWDENILIIIRNFPINEVWHDLYWSLSTKAIGINTITHAPLSSFLPGMVYNGKHGLSCVGPF